MAKYVGRYRWKRSEIYVEVLGGELSIYWLDSGNLRESRTILKPVGQHMFRMTGFNRQEAPDGELFRFDVNAEGRTVKAHFPSMYWLRE